MSGFALIDGRRTVRCGAVLLPVLLLWGHSQDPLWLRSAIMTIALFMGLERAQLAPLGLLMQALAVMAGFLLLFMALHIPVLFVLGCVALAMLVIGLTAYGRRLRSVGNFIFIPSVYLACESAELVKPDQYWAWGTHFLLYMLVSALPVALLSLWEHQQRAGQSGLAVWRHYGQWRSQRDSGEKMPVREALCAACLAVACAAACVEWWHLGNGQWVVWSALTVVSGDVLATKRKLRDRILGALIGVPLGIAVGSLLPHSMVLYALFVLATPMTILVFPHYLTSFTLRCACTSCALTLVHAPLSVEAERFTNVLIGGVIGVGFVLVVHWLLKPPADHAKRPLGA